MDASDDGYVTGGKDGCAKLWDPDFKPITTVNLKNSPEGYKGIKRYHTFNLFTPTDCFSLIQNHIYGRVHCS